MLQAQSATTRPLTVVFGGTGFLGRQVVSALVEAQCRVRVATRHPKSDERDAVEHVAADVTCRESVEDALDGVTAAVNCVSHYVETEDADFDDVHVAGARHVAEAAGQAGISDLVHVSGIGSDPTAASPYVRARGMGEQAVREALPSATLVRPSVMFGPGDAFLSAISGLLAGSPILPLFGRGRTRLQPVHADDVARAIARTVSLPGQHGRTYEFGGPEVVTYRSVVERVKAWQHSTCLLVPFPFPAWKLLVRLGRAFPLPPITEGQVALMMRDNVVAGDALTLRDLGIAATPIEHRHGGLPEQR